MAESSDTFLPRARKKEKAITKIPAGPYNLQDILF
jgi:hypothetical protein